MLLDDWEKDRKATDESLKQFIIFRLFKSHPIFLKIFPFGRNVRKWTHVNSICEKASKRERAGGNAHGLDRHKKHLFTFSISALRATEIYCVWPLHRLYLLQHLPLNPQLTLSFFPISPKESFPLLFQPKWIIFFGMNW